MGFVARTIFWLGLVYNAIPLDFGSLISDRAPSFAPAGPLAACASGATDDCLRQVDGLREALDPGAARGIAERLAQAIAPSPEKDGTAGTKPTAGRAN